MINNLKKDKKIIYRTLNIDSKLWVKLDRFCKRNRFQKSKIVSHIISHYIKEFDKK